VGETKRKEEEEELRRTENSENSVLKELGNVAPEPRAKGKGDFIHDPDIVCDLARESVCVCAYVHACTLS